MGWTLPATLGAKLGAPDRQVVGLMGDGETLMQLQELATAVRYQIPAVFLVLNNMGWISIRDLQQAAFGEEAAYITDFTRAGESYSPDFAAVARDFGAWAKRISRAEQVAPAVEQALRQEGPAVVEILVNRELPFTGTPAVGWWDVPIPAYLTERRAKYEAERDEERLT